METKCETCYGTGRVDVYSPGDESERQPPEHSEQPCEDCGGTGLNDKARIAKLEATVKLLQAAVRRVYQDVPELWEEAV